MAIGLEFVLFAILGWCVFVSPPPGGNGRLVLMILFIILMILWLVAGATGWNLSFPHR